MRADVVYIEIIVSLICLVVPLLTEAAKRFVMRAIFACFPYCCLLYAPLFLHFVDLMKWKAHGNANISFRPPSRERIMANEETAHGVNESSTKQAADRCVCVSSVRHSMSDTDALRKVIRLLQRKHMLRIVAVVIAVA